jgi:hypothetical protein
MCGKQTKILYSVGFRLNVLKYAKGQLKDIMVHLQPKNDDVNGEGRRGIIEVKEE